MTDEYEYFKNKRTDRVYLSRSLDHKIPLKDENGKVQELVRPFRIVSKVIDAVEDHKFIRDGKEISLRITSGERQEIIAKFYEDTRDIFTLQFQRYTVKGGKPHETHFSFVNDEISTLYNFIRNIPVIPIYNNNGAKLDDSFIRDLVLSKQQFLDLVSSQPDLLDELVRNNTTAQEVALLGRRQRQLQEFEHLLSDPNYFEEELRRLSMDSKTKKRPEDLWQYFFENNTWIFGFGLSYQFNTPLDGRRLEQVVRGYDFQNPGKRVDGLIKTRGFLSSLAFVEIKTSQTELVKSTGSPYRSGAWAVSQELSGGVAQVHRTVQESLRNIQTRIRIVGKDGTPTGEEMFLYTPKSFLVIGSLKEFAEEHGVNEQKYSSFEMFRRNLVNPEILTFDELYERAKHIVDDQGDNQNRT